ncbi:MAG TPA: N-formylglutamate amidohydrolase [Cyclobacteriaceae bacterium]|nr:N-formylglutamate amidohydrolase [Cyclobacteriaceae bacterium]
MPAFQVITPSSDRVPILLSVPHCGVEFPPEIKSRYKQSFIQSPDDTDWFVHRLYDFAPAMGITLIHAVYSRWVIDLNRDPQSKPLYTDGRIITALCPTTTFFGESIYVDERKELEDEEVRRRVELYYDPYHKKIQELLDDLKSEFGKVLLWDCHSIRQLVPTINKEKFPDLILGDADGTSASPGLIETAISGLESGDYGFSHNHPFKGGYITRHFGKPLENQHALQLEMTKVNYMDDAEKKYDATRANKMRNMLKSTLGALVEQLAL